MKETLNPVTVKPDNLKPEDLLGFKIIAVIGWDGKHWKAYRGLTSWSDEMVANEGDEISKDVAEGLFYAPVAIGMKYGW